MSGMGRHSTEEDVTDAKPRRDHLWVLVVIAICALAEVWGSWVTIGSTAGFPRLGSIPTDWTLAVVMEAYWGYALYAWLAAADGHRSRRFAMWSAAGVFVLSLIGQAAAHLTAGAHKTPPPAVVVFVTALPVIVLALIAILIHLRHLDRADAEEVMEENALRTELAALRAEFAGAQEALGTAQAERDDAQRSAQEAAAKAEVMARKLAARTQPARGRSARAKKGADAPRTKGADAQETGVPNDVDAQAEALSILAAEPDVSGAQLGPRVGMSKRWGQEFKKNLAGSAPGGEGSQQ